MAPPLSCAGGIEKASEDAESSAMMRKNQNMSRGRHDVPSHPRGHQRHPNASGKMEGENQGKGEGDMARERRGVINDPPASWRRLSLRMVLPGGCA